MQVIYSTNKRIKRSIDRGHRMNSFVFQWFVFLTNSNLRLIDPSIVFTCVYLYVFFYIGNGNADITMDKSTFLKIYFANGSFHGLRYTPSTTIAV
jgi:hypothetical protein